METQSQHQNPTLSFFSGNGQNKNKSTFKYQEETLNVVDKQTYLGLEMTSSGRYAYARDIGSKTAYKVLIDNKKVIRKYGYKYYWNKKQTFLTLHCSSLHLRRFT